MLQRMMIVAVVAALATTGLTAAAADKEQDKASALGFTMKSIDGKQVDLSKYKGKVVLVVNVASECGLTQQNADLQKLHEEYADKGLAILGFPCNQFGGQEPGTEKEISAFCAENYGVKFDMFSKVEVNGETACDLYKYLTALKTEPKGPGSVSWNFEKFLLDREGNVVARFSPRTKPTSQEVMQQIESELAEK